MLFCLQIKLRRYKKSVYKSIIRHNSEQTARLIVNTLCVKFKINDAFNRKYIVCKISEYVKFEANGKFGYVNMLSREIASTLLRRIKTRSVTFSLKGKFDEERAEIGVRTNLFRNPVFFVRYAFR